MLFKLYLDTYIFRVECRAAEGYFSVLRGNNVFTILPTVFGKMLCSTCLPLIFDKLTRTVSRHRRFDAILNSTCISPQHFNEFNTLANCFPTAQDQFTDVNRPFYSERSQQIKNEHPLNDLL